MAKKLNDIASKAAAMESIYEDVLRLKDSPLYTYRTENSYFPVIGEGSLDASIIFVGEAPGENEAKTGKPFCGRSGKVLDLLLESIGIGRQSVYITSVVKDRPQDNRDPEPAEIQLYAPFLDRQVMLLKPKVIAVLGRHAMKYIFETYGLADELRPISEIHGKGFKGRVPYGEVAVVALYHPAVALYNGSMKKQLVEDFKILKKYA